MKTFSRAELERNPYPLVVEALCLAIEALRVAARARTNEDVPTYYADRAHAALQQISDLIGPIDD